MFIHDKSTNKRKQRPNAPRRPSMLNRKASELYDQLQEPLNNLDVSNVKESIVYKLDADKLTPYQTIFSKDEAVLLTFAEMVRKFVLESEYPDIQPYLWRWSENFKYQGKGDTYLYLISKFNLLDFFEIHEIPELWREYIESKCTTNNNSKICCWRNSNSDDITYNFDGFGDESVIDNNNDSCCSFIKINSNVDVKPRLYVSKNIRHRRKLVRFYIFN